jgi:hypothetical protein
MTSFGQIQSAAGSQSPQQFADALLAALPPIYQKENKDTILYKLYTALAEELAKADIVIETVQNNNYISVAVTDELMIRSSGSSDRLRQENAFELDKIRLSVPGSVVSQNAKLLEGTNQVQLFFIPEQDIDFIISDVRDQNRTPLNFPTSFNSSTNTLTIIANRDGMYTITYKDTGNVVRLTENITVPAGLFRLGFGEGGWSELGWGE